MGSRGGALVQRHRQRVSLVRVEAEEYERIFRHEDSHFWYRGIHALVTGALRRRLHSLPGAREGRRPDVLDAGCGTGGLLGRLPDTCRATGLDMSPLALQFAASRGHRRLVRGSVSALPFADARFDAVLSIDVLYHRAVADDAAALAELGRVLRPGGIVLVNNPAHAWLRGSHDRKVHTARRYARADWRRLAAATGLRIERLAWWNASFLLPALVVRTLGRRGEDARSDVRELPALLNAPFSAVMQLEAAAAQAGLLPFGLSLFVVLRKPQR